MNICHKNTVVAAVLAAVPFAAHPESGAPIPAGPYLGQEPPGHQAQMFAPGIVSVAGRYEFALGFSPGGDRLLFTIQNAAEEVMVLQARETDQGWTWPEPIHLTRGELKDEMEAFFAPDGEHVYFAPYNEGLDVRIWRVPVEGDGWGAAEQLPGAIAEHPAFYPTVDKDGVLYYSNIAERKPYHSRQQEDGRWSAEPLEIAFGMHVFVSPDRSVLLLDARAEDSLGEGDIYAAFPKEDGNWSQPVNLGPDVNSEFGESCPSLSADGKYLFFSRYDEEGGVSQIYWVSAEVIEKARSKR